MGTPSMRRTDRVSLTVLLEASGTDSNGQEFKEPTRTLLINRGGAVIILERDLKPEQQIQIRRQAGADSQKTVPARIVGEFATKRAGIFMASRYWTMRMISGRLNFRQLQNPPRR